MKPLTAFYIFGVCMILSTGLSAQSSEFYDKNDTLLIQALQWQQVDSLSKYIYCIKQKMKTFKGRSKDSSIYTLLQDYTLFRDPKTKSESISSRGYYASKIYNDQQLHGPLHVDIDMALKGVDMVWDKELLDSKSWYIENDIGNIYARKDDFDKALYYYQLCIPGLKKRKSYALLCRLYTSIADVYKWKGNEKKRKYFLNEAMRLTRKTDNVSANNAINESLRNLYLENKDFESFSAVLNVSRKYINLSKGRRKEREIQFYLDLGKYNLLLGNGQEVYDYYNKAEIISLEFETNSSVKRSSAKIQHQIADLFFLQEKYEQSRVYLSKALKSLNKDFDESLPVSKWKNQLYPDNTFVDILELMSTLEVLKPNGSTNPRSTNAMEYLNLAIYLNELLNDELIFSRSKNISASRSRELIDQAVDICYQNIPKMNRDDSMDQLRAYFTKSKDLILNRRISLNSSIHKLDDKKKSQISIWRKEYAQAFSSLSLPLDEAQKDSVHHVLFRIKKDIQKWANGGLDESNKRPLEGYYVEYLMNEKYIYGLYNMGNESQGIFRFDNNETFRSLFEQFNQQIKTHDSELELKAILNKMRNFLLPQNIKLPTEFTIIPDNQLGAFPFELLLEGEDYFIKNHTIHYQSHFLSETKGITESKKLSIYCLNPTYDMVEDITQQEIRRPGEYALPFAGKEIEAIKSLFGKKVEVSECVQMTDIDEVLQNHSIFHFSGHAKVKSDSAFLILNSKEGYEYWHDDQIFQHSFDLDLVTLSACETGLGEMSYGDGVGSVARSFIAAGAEAVVYSLWSVNDASTAELISLFYDQVSCNGTTSESLRQAKLIYLEQATPENQHPYYWAGFIFTGHSQVLEKRTKPFWYIIPFMVIGLILTFLWKQKKSKIILLTE